MNKILYWASCLAVCTACNDFLDEMPDNRTSLDSEKNIASLLVTSYPDQTSCLIGEFLSDNIDENRHSFTYWHRLDQELYLLQDPTEDVRTVLTDCGNPAIRLLHKRTMP